jgi:hypothetical protein
MATATAGAYCALSVGAALWSTDGMGASLGWGDGNICLHAPIPQNCHSRESGNPWSYVSARDTILVRTKTRRRGATSSCLHVFVRTILPIVRSMGSRFRGNDRLRGSRRGAFPATSCWSRRRAEHKQVQGDFQGRLSGGDEIYNYAANLSSSIRRFARYWPIRLRQ